METVNCRCESCGNVMAISRAHLGQEVRCPHCQAVVVAPAEAPPTAVDTAPWVDPALDSGFQVPPPEEQESIFSASDDASDDLFGVGPQSKVELPPEANWPPLELASPLPPPLDPGGPGLAPSAVEASEPVQWPEPRASEGAPSVAEPKPSFPILGKEPPGEEAPDASSAPIMRSQGRGRRGAWFTALIVLPLISYSILATIAIAILLSRQRPHPLEVVPDIQGDNPGATRVQGRTQTMHLPAPDQALPEQLQVPLGGVLDVGQLRIRPLNVEVRRIAYRRPGGIVTDTATEDCLALVLNLANISGDVAFAPMDRYFTRKSTGHGLTPYTMLQVGGTTFPGGPSPWPGPEVVEGQDFDQVLQPGEEMTTFICTDPGARAVRALQGYKGLLVWRVQVRRGLVSWRNNLGVMREAPATAVVGVRFRRQDIVNRVR